MTTAQKNKSIKKSIISLMGKGNTSYSKVITEDSELYFESNVVISFESTCVIGKIVEYKITAILNNDTNEIKLIQY